MAWTIEYTPAARRRLRKLDCNAQRRILGYMDERVAPLDNPRLRGRTLSGRLAGLWRYRVGGYRVVCDIQGDALRVLVVDADRRDEVYR